MNIKRLVVAVAVGIVAAQAGAQTLTQKIDVSVVNVDVVVTGADGKPVRGLTRDDFQIFEDGAAQPIANFYAVESATQEAAAAAATPASAQTDDPRFRRKVLVLIDNNHISKRGREIALQRVEEFISDRFRGGAYEWSIAALGSHVSMVLPLTSNKETIHAALEAIRRNASRADRAKFADMMSSRGATPASMNTANWSVMSRGLPSGREFASDADDLDRSMQAQFTTNAIVEASRAFAAAGGKKVILLLTGDPGLNDIEIAFRTAPSVRGDTRGIVQRNVTPNAAKVAEKIATLRNRIIEEANASNVSVYIINPDGLSAGGDIGAEETPMTNNQAVFWLAEQTGGRLMASNDTADAMKQFDTASSNYYSLGFSPRNDDGKYHNLRVKIARPGDFRVQHRAGYSNVSADAQLERSLQSQITMSMDSSTLPVTLTTEAPQAQKDRGAVLVPIQANIPISKLQFLPTGTNWNAKLDVYVSVFDEDGRNIVLKRFTTSATAESANPDPSGTFIYRNGILLRKGQRHRIVVAIRDQATDAVGMAEKTVKF
ncbi:MAG: VWA domain-containing protein [Acidobacteriota bacterium]